MNEDGLAREVGRLRPRGRMGRIRRKKKKKTKRRKKNKTEEWKKEEQGSDSSGRLNRIGKHMRKESVVFVVLGHLWTPYLIVSP